MKFSIITPSYRASGWLRLCVASVADQQGVEHEHIVQDSCSDDGTQDWLPHDPRVRAFIEKDTGMYDAVNRGIRRATGDVIAYLNADEQYLPGALAAVAECFEREPAADIVIADMVVVDPEGDYLCHRMAMRPLRWHLVYRFSVPTATLFVRRRVFADGLMFRTDRKTLSDYLWIEEACRRGYRWAELRRFTSAFTETGSNLGLGTDAVREYDEVLSETPGWQRSARLLIVWHHRLRMLLRGAFTAAPFSYRIYTKGSPDQRREFRADHPTGLWKSRLPRRGALSAYMLTGRRPGE